MTTDTKDDGGPANESSTDEAADSVSRRAALNCEPSGKQSQNGLKPQPTPQQEAEPVCGCKWEHGENLPDDSKCAVHASPLSGAGEEETAEQLRRADSCLSDIEDEFQDRDTVLWRTARQVRGVVQSAADTIKRLREERDIAQSNTDAAIEDYNDLKAQVEKLERAMPKLVDKTWGKAMMDESVPSTKIVNELIEAALAQTKGA